MSFMPGDNQQPVPRFVDVKWSVPTHATAEAVAKVKYPTEQEGNREERYQTYLAALQAAYRLSPIYTRRVDLTPILTPELLAQVRKDHRNTQLKLIITFNNDQVDIKAVACKWQ